MNSTKYLFHVVGEDPNKITKWHKETIDRTKAFGIAIHIPVLLWAITGYVISTTIFNLSPTLSAVVASFCSGLIYLIERIVLATPKKWYVNFVRVLIGVIIAILGASTVDLVIFDKEVTQELRKTEEAKISGNYEVQLTKQFQLVQQKKNEWFAAQEAANCEANGKCGSGSKNLGPIYRALKEQADGLHNDYAKAQADYETLQRERSGKLDTAHNNIVGESGLLARIQSLHQYIEENNAALVAYFLFFALILFFELMVVIAKLVFGETADDEIERRKAEIARHKAMTYQELVTSPLLPVMRSVDEAYVN